MVKEVVAASFGFTMTRIRLLLGGMALALCAAPAPVISIGKDGQLVYDADERGNVVLISPPAAAPPKLAPSPLLPSA